MTYLLYIAFIGLTPPEQIYGFRTAMACEQAAQQVKAIDNRVRATVCLNTDAKEMHWNGKPLKK